VVIIVILLFTLGTTLERERRGEERRGEERRGEERRGEERKEEEGD
jgi:hypothetical protein